MSWSTIWAKASMSVTPGSETLWSVHVGHRRWTIRFASSTRPWKVRSSRFGAGNISDTHFYRGRGARGLQFVLRYHVEREHQVSGVVRREDDVRHVDVQDAGVDGPEADAYVLHVDAWLPALERLADVV